jgi:transcriptional regulator with XRE-family HTH domain
VQAEQLQERLGQRISVLRRRRGLTQPELAQRSGMTPNNLSLIERGGVNVPFLTLVALAKGLEITLTELVLGVDASLPREVRSLEQLVAGKDPREQALLVRLLTAINDLSAHNRDGEDE